MKGSKSLVAISIAVTLALIPSAIAAPKTTVKAAGPLITKVVNTILNGVGVPSKKVGINGDFYIDTKSLVLYGPKTNGAWKNSTSLKQAEVKSVTTVIGEAGTIGRISEADVILKRYFYKAIEKLNPNLPKQTYDLGTLSHKVCKFKKQLLYLIQYDY